MATKRKPRRKKSTGLGNWNPLCVQIEHSSGVPNDLEISISGNIVPNSLYFVQQVDGPVAIQSVTLTWTEKVAYFLNYGQSPITLTLAKKQTAALMLDPSLKPAKPPVINWKYNNKGAGGGIIIQP